MPVSAIKLVAQLTIKKVNNNPTVQKKLRKKIGQKMLSKIDWVAAGFLGMRDRIEQGARGLA